MRGNDAVDRALTLIEERINEHISAAEVAGGVFFSKYHFERMFREVMGDSIMAYVVKRRMSLAARELIETKDTVLDIALRCGYNSHEGFTRAFKAHMGNSPQDYRRKNIAPSSQKHTVKERNAVQARKDYGTEEILKGIDELIAAIKATAADAVRRAESPYVGFFELIGRKAADIADGLKRGCEGTGLADDSFAAVIHRISIIKQIEDAAFYMNILAFNVGLFIARALPEQKEQLNPLALAYKDRAREAGEKTRHIAGLLQELAGLILEDMRSEVQEQVSRALEAGKQAAAGLRGYSYLKDEVNALVNDLSGLEYDAHIGKRLDDLMLRADIIAMTADIDALRAPGDGDMLKGLSRFMESLREARDCAMELVLPVTEPKVGRGTTKHFDDISYQGNILLFYTMGEVSFEKLGRGLTDEQKRSFNEIAGHIQDFIVYTQSVRESGGVREYGEIAGKLRLVCALMETQAEALAEKGGVIKYLSNEVKNLTQSMERCVKE